MAESKRLTRVRDGNLGSLGFLPLELCNEIYAFLLADFSPRPAKVQLTLYDLVHHGISFTKVSHSIDTAILRVSRHVHLEAYGLMVKKNRFVHVKSKGVPNYLLAAPRVPIVNENTDHVSRFKGYVLEVTMISQQEPLPHLSPRAHDPFEVMMLARDLDLLGHGLMQGSKLIPGFEDRVSLTLNLGLVVTANREAQDSESLESLKGYFSEKIQREILQPLHDSLYDLHDIQVCGLVSADVASSTCKSVASARWGGPQEVLDYYAARKEVGMQSLERGEVKLAYSSWLADVGEITSLRTNKHWPRLVQEGGEPFITQLAELYFRLNLNCAHFFMNIADVALQVAADNLKNALQAMIPDHWKEGLTWRPPHNLRAQLHFRIARCLILGGNLRDIEAATDHVEMALLLSPDDPAILTMWRELRLLSQWASSEAALAAH